MADPQRRVQSVHRAFTLLQAIGHSPGGARLYDLAERTGLHRSTAHNLLSTLESLGYVAQPNPGGPYLLTDLVADLHRSSSGGDEALRARVRPLLEEVVGLTGETTCLAVPAGTDYLCIDVVETRQPLRITMEVGTRDPLLGTAIGHLLLAHRPGSAERAREEDQAEWERWLPAIEEARASGFAVEHQGYRADMACVAVPVRQAGSVVAALCVLGPSSRISLGRLREIGVLADRVAQTAS